MEGGLEDNSEYIPLHGGEALIEELSRLQLRELLPPIFELLPAPIRRLETYDTVEQLLVGAGESSREREGLIDPPELVGDVLEQCWKQLGAVESLATEPSAIEKQRAQPGLPVRHELGERATRRVRLRQELKCETKRILNCYLVELLRSENLLKLGASSARDRLGVVGRQPDECECLRFEIRSGAGKWGRRAQVARAVRQECVEDRSADAGAQIRTDVRTSSPSMSTILTATVTPFFDAGSS